MDVTSSAVNGGRCGKAAGRLHHVELWVPDLGRAVAQWGWLLGELGYLPFQDWPDGRSWRLDATYLVIEQSPALSSVNHDRMRPGLNHLAFHAGSREQVDALAAQGPEHGWTPLFPDAYPHAGGPDHYAAYLANADDFEVELVASSQSSDRDLDRWFGAELNNSTWDQLDNGLSELSPPGEQERALYGAYAAAYHWRQAGTVANHGRAEHLVATVAVATGLLDVARHHADRYAELIAVHPAAFADWDRAFAAEAIARVAARAGSSDAGRLKTEARRLAEAVENQEERRICLERLAAEPWQPPA